MRESGNADGIRDLAKRQCGFQENADGIQDLTAARKARVPQNLGKAANKERK